MNRLPVDMRALALRVGLASASSMVLLMLGGCLATAPAMGGDKGVVSGSAAGGASDNTNTQLEKCSETLGTLAVAEDQNAPWYYQLRSNNLGSTVPVLRLMKQAGTMP